MDGETDGTLTDTYVAALQHDLVDLPQGTTLVGVVRKPTPWFHTDRCNVLPVIARTGQRSPVKNYNGPYHAAVDENVPELGPAASLLESVKTTVEGLKMRGICDEEAHNAAWDEVDFEAEYREYLEDSEAARTALETLTARLAAGESLALVCYENTEKKRCHRTILRDVLTEREGA